MIIDQVEHAAMWPLRQLGLDAHRAMASARPPRGRAPAARIEQSATIADKVAGAGYLAIVTRAGDDRPGTEVSVLALEGGTVLAQPAPLHTTLGETLAQSNATDRHLPPSGRDERY